MKPASVTRAAAGIVTALVVFAPTALASHPHFDGPTIDNPRVPPDFALYDQRQNRIELHGQLGKVVLLTFLYTHCPDVCPLTADHLNGALQLLGRARTQVRVFAVSVDPRGDTRASVASFVRRHHLLSEFHYLTAPRHILAPIWHAYGVDSTVVDGLHVNHTLYTLLLDRAGRGRVLFGSTSTSRAIAHDVRLLLGS
jgi:protein SCO1/2